MRLSGAVFMWANAKHQRGESLTVVGVVLAVYGSLVVFGASAVEEGRMQTSPWGEQAYGLRCNATASVEVEAGMPVDVTFGLKSIPESLEPGVKQLNLFLYDEYLELILKNVETGKSFTVRPFSYSHVGGPPMLDRGWNTVLLNGKALEPLKVRFPLVRLYNDLAPGLYECKVEYSFPKEKSRWWHSTEDWNSCGFWHGTVISGPFQLRILEETPKTKEFFAPKRLRYYEREGKVGYTKEDAVRLELPVRNGHFLYTLLCGKKVCFSCWGGHIPAPERGVDNHVSIPEGKSSSYTIKIVEISDLRVHLFMPGPGSPGYKVLWEETFTVERLKSRKNYELTRRYFPPWLPTTEARSTLTASTDDVRAFAISPDGKTLATEDNYGTLELWDAASGDVIFRQDLDVYTAVSRALAFSPDGKVVASRQSDNIITTDVATGKTIAISEKSYGSSMAFSPDGRILAVGGSRLVLLDAGTLRELPGLENYRDYYRVAFSPDGKILALSGGEDLRFWDMARRRKIADLRSERGVEHMAFSPNGKMLATGNRDGIELWDVPEMRVFAFISGFDLITPGSFAFSPDGKILATETRYGTIALYHVPGTEPIAILDTRERICGLGFLPDGGTIVSGGSETIRFWDVADLLVTRLPQERVRLSKSNETAHLKITVSVLPETKLGGPVDMLITLKHDWPVSIKLGQDNDSANCIIKVLDSKGQACALSQLGREVAGEGGIGLLLYNWRALKAGEYHTWIDLARYFRLQPGRYVVSVVVELNPDGYPAEVKVQDIEFEIVGGVLTNAR